jgi:hypothetical protein
MNRGASRIVDLLKIRRADAMIDLAKRMETDFWSKPATSDDTTTPYGVQMYVVKNSTEGFTGGDPTGFSSGTAGIATATYARWKNYSGSYTNKTRADLITKMRKAATYTNFKAPIDIPQYNGSSKYGYYTTYNVVAAMETIAEDQNENLGNDVASKDGIVTFRRTPITWVPQLDADTSDPIYGLNWGVMNPVFLKGEYMREEPETKVAGQHTTFAVHVDTTYNLLCRDRRKQFVLYIA